MICTQRGSSLAIETASQLWFFAALAVGGLLGWLVGALTRFAFGLGVGLLIPGVVAASFALQLLQEFRLFTADSPSLRDGRVVRVDEVAVGGGTTPSPLIEYLDEHGRWVQIAGPQAGAFSVNDRVRVLPARMPPDAPRVARPSQLRGAAIAMLLFGTFPLSLGVWFCCLGVTEHREARQQGQVRQRARGRGEARREKREAQRDIAPDRAADALGEPADERRPRVGARSTAIATLNALLLCAIAWPVVSNGSIMARLTAGFGAVAVTLVVYGVYGVIALNASRLWALGMVVLGVNFAVWAWALVLIDVRV